MVALPVSNAIGSPVSTAILSLQSHGLHGWQWMFLIEGLPATILGIVTVFLLTGRPRDARWLTTQERDYLETTLAEEEEHLRTVREWYEQMSIAEASLGGESATT